MGDPLAEAIAALDVGELVVYPTDTLYGLGCRAADAQAVQRLYDAKGLPPDRGVSVVVHDLDQARRWAAWTHPAEALARLFLPGALTLVLDPSPEAPEHLLDPLHGTLAVRYVDRDETLRLAEGGPVVSTSANRHGEPACQTIGEAREAFGSEVAAYVDAGRLAGPASTVVDARGALPRIIREGAIPEQDILEAAPRG